MLTWMVYVVTVSVFLCGAALAAEYQARLRRTATRWIWFAVIVASLLIPTVIASVSVHEQSHLEAGDPLMLTIALGLLVLMPWKFPLWWQLRRLRRAIEVDCDSRVVRRGIDRKSYGETLLDVGARQSGYIGSVAAMSESRSFLEQRIKLIMSTATQRWRLLGAALGLLSLTLLAVAAEVSPPNADRVEVKVPESVLDEYVGYYQSNGKLVRQITRKGDQLSARISGQLPAEIYPSSRTEFFFKVVNAQIDFVKEGSGPVTALVLHQNGVEINMPRIEPAVAQQLEAALKARVDAQTPAPGSEAAVRMMIEGHIANNLPYSRMSPQLAKAAREQLPRSSQVFKQLGALKSIEFKGVGSMGWDNYEVKFENGVMQYRIALDDDGTVVGALMTASP